MYLEKQKAMQDDYGPYDLKETESLAFKVMPDIDSLVCGAVALLEMAMHMSPCIGPEANLLAAIDACKKATLYDYENLPSERKETSK